MWRGIRFCRLTRQLVRRGNNGCADSISAANYDEERDWQWRDFWLDTPRSAGFVRRTFRGFLCCRDAMSGDAGREAATSSAVDAFWRDDWGDLCSGERCEDAADYGGRICGRSAGGF